MSQFDFGTIDPNVVSGTQLAIYLNDWRDALHTMHRGASRPSYVKAGMPWLRETSADRWDGMLYDGNHDVLMFSINPTTGARINEDVSDTEPSVTSAYKRWWDTSGDDPVLKLRNAANDGWHILGTIVSGAWVPYSAGQSADARYARLSGANDFDTVPTVNGAPFVTPNAFYKTNGGAPAWTVNGTAALETNSEIYLAVGSTLVTIAAGTAVTLPTLSAGTDYTIYAADDGTLEAVDADSAAPADTRKVGGFHARAGDGDINVNSLWDLNWRPSANPRGMTLSLDGRVWADIYLMDTQYGVNGYSRNGAQIADDNDRPITPDAYGGNGTDTYGSMSWWVAVDLAAAAGKRLPFYTEFTAMAYGVVERQAVGTDPGTTQHQAGHRSACGCEQITGVMYQWGADIAATDGSSWRDIAEGRGNVYASNIKAPLFGADWGSGSDSGSRASLWDVGPDNSGSDLGARGVCDHVNLQAER